MAKEIKQTINELKPRLLTNLDRSVNACNIYGKKAIK